MAKKRILIFEIVGAVVVSILAPVFHFLYEWSGFSGFVGSVSAVNESVFEHTKIVFFPYLIFSVVEVIVLYFTQTQDLHFTIAQKRGLLHKLLFVKALTAILLPALVVIFFYTYSGIYGSNILIVDIISTFIFIAIAFFISYKLIRSPFEVGEAITWVSVVVLLVVTALIVIATYFPPEIAFFYDKANGIYGLMKK